MTTNDPGGRLPAALRTEALEQLLTERGLIDPQVMNGIIANYETNVGPLNGAKVVAGIRGRSTPWRRPWPR